MTPMLFVTGMLRCGTTLLEKLLANHPQISLLSQPFPLLFVETKRQFLGTLGRSGEPYPLGDLFLEDGYAPDDFARFLLNCRLSRDQLLATFRAMETYSGQCTRFSDADVHRVIEGLAPGDFASTLTQLYSALGRRDGARWFGGKETLCEEFVPHLVDRDKAAVDRDKAVAAIILRDPRDMLASLNHGRGQQFGGSLKPTLFNLRHWRKSVAFALHLQDHPRVAWMRYEDLVADPVPQLNRLARILDVSPFNDAMFAHGILDQDGQPWQGNSSHFSTRGLDASSVGAYRTVLPPAVTAYAEAVCYPELAALGYPVSIAHDEAPAILAGFHEPYEHVRENLRATFASPDRTAEELARLSDLGREGSRFYVFDDVRELLRTAVAR